LKKPELLAPAGSLSKLKFAFMYGADAVYIGGESFSLREAAENLTERWLMGKIPTNYYKEQMRLNQKEMERLSNSNIIKTYSVTMTEEELRLFSEFLEQKEFEEEDEILIGNDGIHEVDDPIIVGVQQKPNNPGLIISYGPPKPKSPEPEKVGEKYKNITERESFGKDAAIAAGVTAGLVGGGIALRKHLKKKKQEKELVENKYKTSNKKRKK
jgi:hypothetical protein